MCYHIRRYAPYLSVIATQKRNRQQRIKKRLNMSYDRHTAPITTNYEIEFLWAQELL